MSRRITVAALCLMSTTAWADMKICLVDAESAINETREGKAAQAKLETMYASRQAEIEKRQKDLEREFQDYEARQAILSDEARKASEQALWEKRQEFQASVYQAEQDMQSTYMSLLGGMEEKLMKAAESLGASRGCALLLNKAAVIYVGTGVTDLTLDLIREYDARN